MPEFITHAIEDAGYLGVAMLMALETIFPPIPSEVIMPLAGLQAARGDLNILGVIASGTAGAMFGNIFWYWLARWVGAHRIVPFVKRFGRLLTMSVADVERAHRWFDRHGAPFVLFGRLVPTMRSLVSVPAGVMEMNFHQFVLYSTIGTAGWTALLAMAGLKLGENYTDVESYVGPVALAVLVVLAIGYLFRVVTWKAH
jgi:membrane protein DedA with SNARE-associated domain